MKIPKQFNNIFYPTRKIKMVDIMPDGWDVNENKAAGIVVDSPNGPILVNTAAPGYGLVNNKDLLMPLYEEMTKAFGELEIKVVHHRQAEFYVDLTVKEHRLPIAKGDIISPKIRWHNSYNGTIKHEVSFGALRLVCTNGMTLPVWDKHIKFRHTAGIETRSRTKTIESIADFIDKFDDFTEGYKVLMEAKVDNIDDRIEEVIKNTKFPNRQADQVQSKVREEAALLNAPVTDWLIYNAFNFQLNHNSAIKSKDHKKEKVDQEVLQYLMESA